MRMFLFGVLLLGGGTGCLHVQPIGPFAKQIGGGSSPAGRPTPGAKVSPVADGAVPMLAPAPPPPQPSVMVTPGEVADGNPQDAARRLREEMDADRKAIDAIPRYSEVSVIKK